MTQVFMDRRDAGRQLAVRVAALALDHPFVLALPRGGVPVAAEVARVLRAPLDVLMVRKIGMPLRPELALAAVVDGQFGPGGQGDQAPELVIDRAMLQISGVDRRYVEQQARNEWDEIQRRRQLYRRGRPPPRLNGCSVVLVDDGVATGTTVRAALQVLRRTQLRRLVLAVPVGPVWTLEMLREEVDDLICVEPCSSFRAVGEHYEDFEQLSDEQVQDSLALVGHCLFDARAA